MQERVVLVDEQDKELGSMEKLKAHYEGILHRAFSVFIFNENGQLLLQKRANGKYHSGRLWSNSCCSHPRPGEALDIVVRRRLMEEMGFACHTREIFSTVYKAKLDNDIIENEFDHIFIGEYNGLPNPEPQEVEEWKWMDITEIKNHIKVQGQNFTVWFPLLFDNVIRYLHCPDLPYTHIS